jgi:hypothetical protein
MPMLSRRLLLAAGGVMAVLALAPRLRRADPVDRLGLDRDAAAAVGRAYLDACPEEADPGRLEALLTGELREGSLDSVRRRLANRRRGDFARGDVVVVRGWVLARSEARLCALISLTCEAA